VTLLYLLMHNTLVVSHRQRHVDAVRIVTDLALCVRTVRWSDAVPYDPDQATRGGYISAGIMRKASKRLVKGMIVRKCRWSRVRISLVS